MSRDYCIHGCHIGGHLSTSHTLGIIVVAVVAFFAWKSIDAER